MDDAFWLHTIGATLTALVATLGGIVNSILRKRMQHRRDVDGAARRIRHLYERLGMMPPEITTMNDVFVALKLLREKIEGERDERKGP